MKQIYKSIPQTISINESSLGTSKTIKITIIGEDGKFILDHLSNPIKDIILNEYAGIYSKEITFHQNTPEQYIRVYFQSNDTIILPKYHPEDYSLIDLPGLAQTSELVPVGYFLDFVLASGSKLDIALTKGIQAYLSENRAGITSILKAAESELEQKTKLYFSERTLIEKKDYFFDKFTSHLWQFVVQYPPIVELVDFSLKIADHPIIEVPKELFVFNPLEGVIEFLPVPTGATTGLYSMLLQNFGAFGMSIMYGGIERIPCFFHATYKTGIFNALTDKSEKEMIRQLVSRRALVKLLPVIDPGFRQTSRTEGIDGVSSSRSYAGDRFLNIFQQQEEETCKYLMQKYGKNFELIIL
ncbi:MAG: hypothetical protein LCH52_08295 [Bacteroidetes bacterium]|nr:hypothetical protein [Bacteroidota bacterium]